MAKHRMPTFYKVNMSTSKLQTAVGDLLDKAFPQFTIRENYRPDWLMSSNITKLELDFYIEELKIAFEVQGSQHYQYVPFFHGNVDNFEQRKLYDQEKQDLCYGNGVRLIEICTLMDAILAISSIEQSSDLSDIVKKKKNSNWKNLNKLTKKYMVDEYHLRKNGDPIATVAEKAKERKQFRKKCKKYLAKGLDLQTIYFQFQYLNSKEQGELLNEIGILENIFTTKVT